METVGEYGGLKWFSKVIVAIQFLVSFYFTDFWWALAVVVIAWFIRMFGTIIIATRLGIDKMKLYFSDEVPVKWMKILICLSYGITGFIALVIYTKL